MSYLINEWNFGTDRKTADKLLALVKSGQKTATTGLYHEHASIPKKGDKAYINDSEGNHICAIVYTKVEVKPFLEVDFRFAKLEGEGDKDIEEWRESHRKYFIRENGKFSDNSLMVCEEFMLFKLY